MPAPSPHYHLLAESRPSNDGNAATQWRFLLEAADGSLRLDIADAEPDAPADRVELLALVRGLEALDHPAHVTVVTASRYVSHGLRFGLDQWRENGWQWEAFGQMTPIKNEDLWRRIDQALAIHRVECKTLRADAPQEGVAPPHAARTGRRRTERAPRANTGVSPTARTKRTTARQESAPTPTLAGRMRGGVARWLHGLGEYIAPRTTAMGH